MVNALCSENKEGTWQYISNAKYLKKGLSRNAFRNLEIHIFVMDFTG